MVVAVKQAAISGVYKNANAGSMHTFIYMHAI